MYFLAINRTKPDTALEKLRAIVPTHIAWVEEQLAAGVFKQAGKWGDTGGIAVIKATSVSEARAIAVDDPLARAGLVDVEVDAFFPDVAHVDYADMRA